MPDQIAKSYDAVVVGAGPAGSAAARGLSSQGLKVLLVERSPIPRYKMCSGVISPTARKFVADHFGELPGAIIADPPDVYGAKVYVSTDGPIVDVLFSETDKGPGVPDLAISVKRADFDHWLATHSGAEVRDGCRFVSVSGVASALQITLKQGPMRKTVTARYLVGADGPMSTVRRSIDPDFDKGLRLIPNYEEWYRGSIDLEPKWLNVFMDRKLTSYFASIFHKDGKIAVVTGARWPESAKAYYQELRRHLETHHGLVVEEELGSYGCVLHDMSATENFHYGEGNILLVGEAGGFSRAFGEGISSALVTGQAAADAILECLRSPGANAREVYRENARPEAELCIALNRMIDKEMGLNPFTR